MAQAVRVIVHQDGIYELRIDHAESKNRISEELCRELRGALHALRDEAELKVLVLAGRPDVFCAGATPEVLDRLLKGEIRVNQLYDPRELLQFPYPVLGALEGPAVGGGLALALGCDVLVAAEGSRYGFNFAQLGFTPELATTLLLPQRVGLAFASEMLLTGRLYKGRELQTRRLFEHAEPSAQVRDRVWDLARRMAETPRQTLRLLKERLAQLRAAGIEEALDHEERMQQITFAGAQTRALVEERYIAS